VALSNVGNAKITLAPVSNVTSIPLSGSGGDITLTFDPNALGAGVPGFTVAGGPGGTLAYDPATEAAGKQFTLGGAFTGISFKVNGVPNTGDTLTITDNIGGVSDNSNALLLSGLQTQTTIAGNNTYQGAYGQLVAEVGVSTHQAEVTRDAQDVLLRQAIAKREEISGVNLDEEAADLLRYQQAYQAAAQVISTVDNLFQELIGVLRR
jgi:flagellar hook-associated protein 1 FlgK